MKHLLSGNEAIARGLYEAGATLAVGYPGTPSTEILESCVKAYKDTVRCEWAPNEKVALEVAAGAAMAGARTAVTMKHVGLNVAADPMMTLAYTGTPGGLVFIVADDPGMHSSQNEQDTRHFARFAKIPIFEPADSAEAKQFIKVAFEVSEKYGTPVILRSTTRVSHSRSLVTFDPRVNLSRKIGFVKNPTQFVVMPAWARRLRMKLEERLQKMAEDSAKLDGSEAWEIHRVEMRSHELGIVTEGIAYQYVREVFPEASILKLGCAFPLPDKLVREFASTVKNVLVVEELEDFTELQLKAMGIPCEGKKYVPKMGELTPDIVRESKNRYKAVEPSPTSSCHGVGNNVLPQRPPTLCAGCPHRGIFYALTKMDCDVTGDIGCYSLGVLPPLNRMDTTICMGAGVSMAHGMTQSGQSRKVVGIVGDSTFFHSGITGLLNIAWHQVPTTIIVVDNRITAMTGHQDNPGTGVTLMGETTTPASIEEISRACGIKNVVVCDPLNHAETLEVLKKAIESEEPWVVISRSPCVLAVRKRTGNVRKIDLEKCKACKMCLKLGCPALECTGEKPSVNPIVCNGCSLCNQICPFGAISDA